jgi:hypothetical protein
MRRLLAALAALSLLGGAVGCRPCIMGICDCGDNVGVHCAYGCCYHHTMPAYLTHPPAPAEPIPAPKEAPSAVPPVKGDGLQ